MDTDALIDRLAGEAAPVHRMQPVWMRAALWFGLAIPPLVLVVAVHGVAGGAVGMMQDTRLLIEQVATLVTALTAAAAAFASTIPGVKRRWLWLPVVPLAVWLLAIGKGCIDEWFHVGSEGLVVHADLGCFFPMLLVGAVPAAAMGSSEPLWVLLSMRMAPSMWPIATTTAFKSSATGSTWTTLRQTMAIW